MFDSLIITPDGMNSTYHVPLFKLVVWDLQLQNSYFYNG